MAASQKVSKIDPFRTRSTKVEVVRSTDALTPPAAVARAVDLFREAQDQLKHYEGEVSIHKEVVASYGEEEHARRLLHGTNRSFRVLGEESAATFVVVD